MGELVLTGCRATPLSGYLSALGVHRAVARTLDAEAEGYWQRGVYVLRCRFSTIDDLAAALHANFQPESIVAPWNSGSGFAAKGTSPTAERIVQWVRDSTDERLGPLRDAVAGGDRVISEAARLGITDLWDKNRKPDVLRLCRNELPDAALAWLDAAIALGQDNDPSYSRLLGTGGNLGRQELSVTYLQQVRTVLESRKSLEWLTSALDGQQRAPFPKESPGQFDPGGVGAPDEPNSVGNPWTFLFLIEGTLLFATAVVRRYGSAYRGAALPFQVWGPRQASPRRRRKSVRLRSCGHRNGLSPCASPTSRICSVRGVPTGTSTPHGQVWIWRARQPHSVWIGASPRFIGMSSSTGSGAARSPCPLAASR